jgi:hypothetical protein
MQITRENLLESDFDTLFTRDPSTFFESILINILWDKEPKSVDMEVVTRQRYVFLKWLEYSFANQREEIISDQTLRNQIIGELMAAAPASYDAGFLAGQIHALTTLPVKKTMMSKTVDLIAVSEQLRKLKAQEPIGVKSHES